jgi:hypothetical protein
MLTRNQCEITKADTNRLNFCEKGFKDSILGQSSGIWGGQGHWDKFFSESFGFPLSISLVLSLVHFSHPFSSEDEQQARKSGRSSVRRQSIPHNQPEFIRFESTYFPDVFAILLTSLHRLLRDSRCTLTTDTSSRFCSGNYQCVYNTEDDCLLVCRASTSETSVHFYQTTRRNLPEDSHLHTRCRENLKSHQNYVRILISSMRAHLIKLYLIT